MKKMVSCAVAAVFVFAVLSPVSVLANPSRTGSAVAFGKVDTSSGTLITFGGKGTKTASVDYSVSGYAEVVFTGKYPKTITPDKVVINATCVSDNYGVANAYVISATPTEIIVGVYGWKSDTLAYQNDVLFFSVFVGY